MSSKETNRSNEDQNTARSCDKCKKSEWCSIITKERRNMVGSCPLFIAKEVEKSCGHNFDCICNKTIGEYIKEQAPTVKGLCPKCGRPLPPTRELDENGEVCSWYECEYCKASTETDIQKEFDRFWTDYQKRNTYAFKCKEAREVWNACATLMSDRVKGLEAELQRRNIRFFMTQRMELSDKVKKLEAVVSSQADIIKELENGLCPECENGIQYCSIESDDKKEFFTKPCKDCGGTGKRNGLKIISDLKAELNKEKSANVGLCHENYTYAKEISDLQQRLDKAEERIGLEQKDNDSLCRAIASLQRQLDKAEKCIKLAHDNRNDLYEVSHILHNYYNEFLAPTGGSGNPLNTSQVESKEVL